MKTYSSIRSLFVLTLITVLISSCEKEDYGPYQPDEQSYNLTNFNRLDIGDAFRVEVRQGSQFSILVRGDRRNLNDLDVWVNNGTLRTRYRNNRNRQYDTSIEITMPDLRGIDFSGAVSSDISGFSSNDSFDVRLSGASKADVSLQASRVDADLSGASRLYMRGTAAKQAVELSGASLLDAFDLQSDEAVIEASGASTAKVRVSEYLNADASGASKVRYIGSARLDVSISGGSSVQRE